MKVETPEISWFGRKAILSLDCQHSNGSDLSFRLATASCFDEEQKFVRIWKVELNDDPAENVNVTHLCGLKYHDTAINVARFSPDGVSLATGDSDGMIVIWHLQEQTNAPDIFNDDDEQPLEKWVYLRKLRDHLPQSDVLDLCWNPDSNKLISCGIDHCVIIYDIEKGCKLSLIKEHESRYAMGITWDPQNQYFVSLLNARAMNVYCASTNKRLLAVTQATISGSDNAEPIKSKLFHDESLFTFCRRLSFSPCGELLFVPAGCIEGDSESFNATYIFTRHSLNKPAVVLSSKKEIPVAIRCCPVVFSCFPGSTVFSLPYRIVFAVITKSSVIIYETQKCRPVAYLSNLQFGRVLDCSWSADARCLVVSAEEGYCTFVKFGANELGTPLENIPSAKDTDFNMDPMTTEVQSDVSSEALQVENDVNVPKPVDPNASVTNEIAEDDGQHSDMPRRVTFVTISNQPLGEDMWSMKGVVNEMTKWSFDATKPTNENEKPSESGQNEPSTKPRAPRRISYNTIS